MALTHEQLSEALNTLMGHPDSIKRLKAHLASYGDDGEYLAPAPPKDEAAAKEHAARVEKFKSTGLSDNMAAFAAGIDLPKQQGK